MKTGNILKMKRYEENLNSIKRIDNLSYSESNFEAFFFQTAQINFKIFNSDKCFLSF